MMTLSGDRVKVGARGCCDVFIKYLKDLTRVNLVAGDFETLPYKSGGGRRKGKSFNFGLFLDTKNIAYQDTAQRQDKAKKTEIPL